MLSYPRKLGKGPCLCRGGKITTEEYMEKLEGFVGRMVNGVKKVNNQVLLSNNFHHVASYYK